METAIPIQMASHNNHLYLLMSNGSIMRMANHTDQWAMVPIPDPRQTSPVVTLGPKPELAYSEELLDAIMGKLAADDQKPATSTAAPPEEF